MTRRRQSIKKILQDRLNPGYGLGYIWLFLALFVCLSLLLWNISRVISKGYREIEKVKVLSSEVEKLEKERAFLEKELEYAKSDVAGEEGARNLLGMAYEGEEVIFLDEGREESEGGDGGAKSEDLKQQNKENRAGPPYWLAWIRVFID